ncbi:RnfABCDGE type electron transport complex subunit G [Pseudomonas sp. MG-9]|uniref:Ion-translocating oxidoreductase complex subunit G n=1 Tax=Pseudomonas serboccidentalis TaxID=2964670 RepID=A0ABY7Z305_9PSED|nr:MULTISPECIES: RnfABCDGE type electron transport complex subunit G [Pseudomonas]MBT9267585.1 RnfABCDGE type electron transport complex subunit G [Pseudomonas sp. MG-9]WDR33937.1 RnfABCDGE type electron transport complex subunit G [Pseudomonas serboccidentalis]
MNRTASVIALVLIAGAGLGLTYVVQRSSAPQIAIEQRLLDSRKLLDVLAADSYDNQPLEQPLALADTQLSHSTLLAGYRASNAGQPVAVLLRTQTEGYAGAIELLIAIDANGRLLGVKTLRQNETPALGGLIGDWPNTWLAGFSGKSRSAPDDAGWALKKDQGQFDQLAGATITSRATVNAIHDALRYFDEHRATLLGIEP